MYKWLVTAVSYLAGALPIYLAYTHYIEEPNQYVFAGLLLIWMIIAEINVNIYFKAREERKKGKNNGCSSNNLNNDSSDSNSNRGT